MTKRRWSPPGPLRLAEITILAEKIEALPERERLYARSLIAQAMRRGTLSDKQLRAVARLAATVKQGEVHTG
jgi:hypothetical protein